MNTVSKKSFVSNWTHNTYTKYVAPAYNFLTTITGWRQQLSKHALTDLPPGSLLDVGCGTGYFMEMARQAGFQVKGIEPSIGMAEKANRNYQFSEQDIVRTTADSIPFADESFDIVLASGSLVHVSNIEAVASEITRVLRPGARLRIIDHATPLKRGPLYPLLYSFSQLSGDIIHDYESIFKTNFKLIQRKTLGRAGYLQLFDFEKSS